MSRPVILRPAAERDLEDGHDWYEAYRPGDGKAFARFVRAALVQIGKMPRLHRAVCADVRRRVLHPYPYCIYYRELPDRIDVISVFHSRRDPADWQRRV